MKYYIILPIILCLCIMAESVESLPKKRAITQEKKAQLYKMKYNVLLSCNSSCIKWSKAFSEDHRKEINSQFWSMTYAERKLWISQYFSTNNVQRRYLESYKGQSRKNNSLVYFLPSEQGKKEKVCNRMFFRLLARKLDGVIYR